MGDARPPGIPPDAEETVIPGATGATPTTLFEDRYRIERVIGEGAFGRVYLALDTRLRRNVAVKELLASRNTTDHATYERYLERFQREARATGMIQQPNVVTVYDLHVDAQGNNYLVMEYVDGTNLRDLLAQVGTLPVGRAIAIATDVARGLEAVHEQEIVHRDLKPANIMITRRGVAKLMDFGIAQVGHESLRTQVASGHPGTPVYMSPEQASGYGYIDGRSDLYSLGLVLYEMLVGEPYARRHQPLGAVRGDLPPQLVRIVDRSTAREVDARYQGAADVLADLEALGTNTIPAAADVYLPNSDQLRPATPPAPGWPTNAGTAAPPPAGVPSSYGGPSSQNPAGAPFYTPSPPPPSATGTGSFAPPPYAVAPGYGPPPSGSPPKRTRGLLFGIGGALIAVIAVVFIVLPRLYPGPLPPTATVPPPATVVASTLVPTSTPASTPTPAATARATTPATVAPTVAPTASATATRAPSTTSVPATVAPTARPTVATTPGPNGLSIFTDPNKFVRLQYPSAWKPTRLTDDKTNVLELDGPDNLYFWAYVDDPQQGSITDEIDIIKKNQGSNDSFSYTNQVVTDLMIGGEPAKSLAYTFASKTDTTNTGPGQWWIANHGGRQFSFRSNFPGAHQAEINAVLNSVVFSNTWTDPKGLVTLQYPNGWTVTKETGSDTNVLELDGPDGTYFYLNIYDPQTAANVTDEIADIRNVHTKDTKFTYVDGAVSDTKVGGEPAKTFPYTYAAKDKPGATPLNGAVWDVNHGGKEYLITGDANAAHKAEIDAIVASIAFLK